MAFVQADPQGQAFLWSANRLMPSQAARTHSEHLLARFSEICEDLELAVGLAEASDSAEDLELAKLLLPGEVSPRAAAP